MSGNFKSYV